MEASPTVQARVIKYYEYMWRRQKSGTANEGSFIQELPLALKADLQLHLHRQLVEKVHFFKDCDKVFLQDIVPPLVPIPICTIAYSSILMIQAANPDG